MTPYAPWLLTAPPREPDGRGPDPSTQGPASRKRGADANATSAETQLGKLVHAFALVARRKGWRHLITETRGVDRPKGFLHPPAPVETGGGRAALYPPPPRGRGDSSAMPPSAPRQLACQRLGKQIT